MPNSNYNRGRRFEWKVKKAWENMGFLVFRTAGSKSDFDLIAVCLGEPSVFFIQCKSLKNGTKKQALNMVAKFKANPPFTQRQASDNFIQVLEVYAMKDRCRERGTT